MPMFRKKPVVIEARQYANDDTSYDTLHWVNDGQLKRGRDLATWDCDEMIIPTLEGGHVASPGDWIIKGIAGEFYPCKPEIFEATYDPAGV